jgi:hypothetical protein
MMRWRGLMPLSGATVCVIRLQEALFRPALRHLAHLPYVIQRVSRVTGIS